MALTAWQEQKQYSANRDMYLAQGARVGRSTHKVFTKGRGDIRIAQPVNFALTFCEEPTFTSGVVLHAGSLVDHLYPLATVGVYQWKKDSRGMYVGAYIWASVSQGVNAEFAGDAYLRARMSEQQARMLPPSSLAWEESMVDLAAAKAALAANQYQLEHHLVFEALAIRDINYDVMMAD